MYYKENCYLTDSCKLDTCKYTSKDDTCLRLFKIDFLLDKSLITEKYKSKIDLFLDSDRTDLREFDFLRSIEQDIYNFVSNGSNLYICSKIPGNGKTSWSIKLLKAYILKIWPESKLECKALFVNVPKFILELKSNISSNSEYAQYVKTNIINADLVVWDDIATKSMSEFEHEHLLSLLDNRLINNKSNIFTSNILPDNLHILAGDRLASRIKQSIIVEFKGKDKRGVLNK